MTANDPGLARAPSTDGPTARCALTVLATSDLHLHLCPWDYYADRPAPGTGLVAAAGEIGRLRASLPNALLVDNGDFLQGTALADALAAAGLPGRGRLHPMVAAMNLLDYDAVSLGNHDFNFGLDFLGAALAGARFPVLCANLRRCDGGPTLFSGWTILERRVRCDDGRLRPLRLGLAGFLPPQVMVWDDAHLKGRMQVEGIVQAARRVVPQMIAAGAEVVVALCHSGIGPASAADDPAAEHAALAVAALPGVDAVVAGHSHQVFPGPQFAAAAGVDPQAGLLAGKPACMPGYGASHLGVLTLALERGPDRRWQCHGGTGAAVSLSAVAGAGPPTRAARPRTPARGAAPGPAQPGFAEAMVAALPVGDPAAALIALCETAHAATWRHLDRPAGVTAVALTSHFAMTGDCVATRLVAQAQAWHVAAMLKGTAHAGLPVLGAAAPTRAGGRGGPGNYTDLAAGPLRERDIAALCPFPNAIRALRVTGADLLAWLNHGAQAFRQIDPGSRDAALLNPDWPAYNFDVIEGLTYDIDLARCHGRIRDLRHDGRPVRPQDEFALATTSYRAAGGGGFPACGPAAQIILAAPTLVRSIVGAFLSIEGPWHAPDTPVWRFAAQPGTTVTLDTGPGARAHLPRPGLDLLGPGDGGFVRLRLAL